MAEQYQNRIVRSGVADPEELLANPNNWRVHPGYQQDALDTVLSDVGFVQSVVVNERTGHLVDGHLRVMLALRKGQKAVPVNYVDLSPAEEAAILATLDPISAMAVTDKAQLADLIDAIGGNMSEKMEDLLSQMRPAVTGPLTLDYGTDGDEFDEAEPIPVSQIRMAQLFFNAAQYERYTKALDVLERTLGTDNATDTVYAVVIEAAKSAGAEV